MKKKQRANLVMVALIVVIAAAGIFTAGHLLGWFDRDESAPVLTDVKGVVTVQRGGMAYTVGGDLILRDSDRITTSSGAPATVRVGESYLKLNGNAQIEVRDAAGADFYIHSGEVFCLSGEKLRLGFEGQFLTLGQEAALVSIHTGTQTVSFFSGSQSGRVVEWVSGAESQRELQLEALNFFALNCVREADSAQKLCFSPADVTQLEKKREEEARKELEDLLNQPTEPPHEHSFEVFVTPSACVTSGYSVYTCACGYSYRDAETPPFGHDYVETVFMPTFETGGYTLHTCTRCGDSYTDHETGPLVPQPTEHTHDYTAQTVSPSCTDGGYTIYTCACGDSYRDSFTSALGHSYEHIITPPTIEAGGYTTHTCSRCGDTYVDSYTEKLEPKPVRLTCTITIRCDTILDNWDNLNPDKAAYVPNDGVILPTVTVSFTEGETVFDVLRRACETAGIQLEYSWTPMYDTYYVEGINHLYEFDCGGESGWMYKVDGWFPNYGCSAYTLTGGESIVWCYSCNGYGTDVGAPEWGA